MRPALLGLDVGGVAYHVLVGGGGGEVSIRQVGDRAGIAGTVVVAPSWPGLTGDQVELARQLSGQLGGEGLAVANELGVRATVPVGVVGMVDNSRDECGEVVAASRGGRGGSVSPFVIF
ncbi:MAG: hypothetical protein ACRDQ4_08105 [Pseudonocardiaceae bacterium]